jgi:hypothetical protein
LPGVGYIPALKAFVEDRGAKLIPPMLFTRFYDVEFSKEVIVFDPNKMTPTIPYVHSPNPDVRLVIRVNIGAGSADVVLDTGANQNECTSVLATICYPVVHVPLDESLGRKKQATYEAGYRVPIHIPGIYSGFRTFYISDIRESKLSLLSATQFLDEGWRLRYGEHGLSRLATSDRHLLGPESL